MTRLVFVAQYKRLPLLQGLFRCCIRWSDQISRNLESIQLKLEYSQAFCGVSSRSSVPLFGVSGLEFLEKPCNVAKVLRFEGGRSSVFIGSMLLDLFRFPWSDSSTWGWLSGCRMGPLVNRTILDIICAAVLNFLDGLRFKLTQSTRRVLIAELLTALETFRDNSSIWSRVGRSSSLSSTRRVKYCGIGLSSK